MDPNIDPDSVSDDRYTGTMAGRIRDELIRPAAEPIPSDFSWSNSLKMQVHDGLRVGLDGIAPDDMLFVNKTALKSVFGLSLIHI